MVICTLVKTNEFKATLFKIEEKQHKYGLKKNCLWVRMLEKEGVSGVQLTV